MFIYYDFLVEQLIFAKVPQSTEVRFASFLSGGFITAIVVNPLERKLAKRTFKQSTVCDFTVAMVFFCSRLWEHFYHMDPLCNFYLIALIFLN